MGKTTIQWTNETWNPVTGCTKVSTGCKHCYAERLFPRVYGKDRQFSDVKMHPERLEQPLHWRKPRKVFVNSMSDLFHENVPFDFVDDIFNTMALADNHIFQILTKRTERMLEFISDRGFKRRIDGNKGYFSTEGVKPWPLPNIWLGVSVENQEQADKRIPLLLQTPAAVRFLSCEPLLGPIDLTYHGARAFPVYKEATKVTEISSSNLQPPIVRNGEGYKRYSSFEKRVDWVIVGGESGPGFRNMEIDWARDIRDQCKSAGVPFFFKQYSGLHPKKLGRELDGVVHDGYPEVQP